MVHRPRYSIAGKNCDSKINLADGMRLNGSVSLQRSMANAFPFDLDLVSLGLLRWVGLRRLWLIWDFGQARRRPPRPVHLLVVCPAAFARGSRCLGIVLWLLRDQCSVGLWARCKRADGGFRCSLLASSSLGARKWLWRRDSERCKFAIGNLALCISARSCSSSSSTPRSRFRP